ncbi:MAG: UbiA family prenyltransferase [Candidatus Levybacteria bacterium]|nr:UbiA family prenyltransferase [Candidatus Levybacteria bacterium]
MRHDSFLTRLYKYQSVRFPIFFLALSFLPPILSSSAIVSAGASLFIIVICLFISLLYLFHVRIADEARDLDHDAIHHRSRPIQSDIIELWELRQVDIVIAATFFSLTPFFGIISFSLGIIMWIYAFLAEKEFYVKEVLKRHFFLYNGVNIIQMFLLQIMVYTIFSKSLHISLTLVLHFLFTCTGTVIFEFLRKLKLPGKDGTGKDTYTWHIGFGRAITVYIILAMLNILFFLLIVMTDEAYVWGWIVFSLITASVLLITALVHFIKKHKITNYSMQLNFLFMYSLFNIIIYLIF